MSVAVVLVAAGSGQRLGAAVPKAFVDLHGRSLLRWALDQCVAVDDVTHIIVAAPGEWLLTAKETALDAVVEAGRADATQGRAVDIDVVVGGAERRASVSAGLGALHESDGIVLVHDAARALAPPDLFRRIVATVRRGAGAVVPGLAVTDTIKIVDEAGVVVDTPARSGLRAVQTPQGFIRSILEHAHEENLDAAITDDAGLVELTGSPIHVVDGDAWAAKITTRDDLDLAARRLDAAQESR